MAAPYGNRNAEKWSLKKAISLLNDAIELSSKKENDIYNFDFIGEIAAELGTYHELITRDLPTRFPMIKRLVNQLIRNMERNCYSNTKKGHIKEATGIVNLKSNHKWKDRVDNTTDDKPINTINVKFS